MYLLAITVDISYYYCSLNKVEKFNLRNIASGSTLCSRFLSSLTLLTICSISSVWLDPRWPKIFSGRSSMFSGRSDPCVESWNHPLAQSGILTIVIKSSFFDIFLGGHKQMICLEGQKWNDIFFTLRQATCQGFGAVNGFLSCHWALQWPLTFHFIAFRSTEK